MCGVTRCGCRVLAARFCSTGSAQKVRPPAESLRVSTSRQNRPPENPSAFALATALKSLCILCLASYPNRSPPTGSAEEPDLGAAAPDLIQPFLRDWEVSIEIQVFKEGFGDKGVRGRFELYRLVEAEKTIYKLLLHIDARAFFSKF